MSCRINCSTSGKKHEESPVVIELRRTCIETLHLRPGSSGTGLGWICGRFQTQISTTITLQNKNIREKANYQEKKYTE